MIVIGYAVTIFAEPINRFLCSSLMTCPEILVILCPLCDCSECRSPANMGLFEVKIIKN